MLSTVLCSRTMGFVKQARHQDIVIGLLGRRACNHLSALRYCGTVVGYITDVFPDLENEHPLIPAVYLSGEGDHANI